jgi:hypothetical protein
MYNKSRRRIARENQINQWPDSLPVTNDGFAPDRAKTAEFALGVHGKIIFPWDSDYEEARQEFNPAFQAFPVVIVYCETENDVRLAILYAQVYNLWVVGRSGGHSTAGYSVNNGGMVIDVSRIKYATVDRAAMTATVGAGTNFGFLNNVLNTYKVHVPSGACEDVCVGGYMQGGGYGYTSRAYGMNCDNVLEFRMMLRDGETVTANETQNSDLFWAVRGGTGNNFGILLEVTYRVHDLWKVWGFALEWDLEFSAKVLVELQQNYMKYSLNNKVGYMGNFAVDPHGKYVFVMQGMYAGDREAGRASIDSLLNLGNPKMSVDITLPYSEMVPYLDDHPFAMPDPPSGVKQAKQAGYIARMMDEDEWQKVIEFYMQSDHPGYDIAVIEPYGGAINSVAEDKMAFNHRDVYMDFFIDSFWLNKEDKEPAEKWLADFIEVMTPFFSDRVYQNYPCTYFDDYRHLYWGEAFPKLLDIKQKYDPEPCFFHFQQSIKPYGEGEAEKLGRSPSETTTT